MWKLKILHLLIVAHFRLSKGVSWIKFVNIGTELNWYNGTCKTNDCTIFANQLERGINKSADPCHNFYDFVCGSFKSNYKIPGYTPEFNRFYLSQMTVYRRLKEILKKKPYKSDILPVRQAKKWYHSCMNSEELEKESIKPIESILMQAGGWLMTMEAEEWDDDSGPSWQKVEQHYFRLTGSYIFYDIKMLLHSNSGDIVINRGKLPIFEKLPFYYRNFQMGYYGHYIRLISEVVQIFVDSTGASVAEKIRMDDIKNMILFEKEIFMLGIKDVAADEDKILLTELIEWYNGNITKLNNISDVNKFNFEKLIKKVAESMKYSVDNTTKIIIDNLEYYINLTKLINNTPKRTIVNYLHWHFISNMLTYTTEKMRNLYFKFIGNDVGITVREPRWLECLKEMKMIRASSYAFLTKFFSHDIEKNVREMFVNIRDQMKLEINASDWLDDETKRIVVEKLDKMKVCIGASQSYKNKSQVLEFYKGLIIGPNYFDNVLSFMRFSIKEQVRSMKWKEQNALDVDPILINAIYNVRKNSIGLPAAIFQPPLFSKQFPSSINYGVIGSLIGHEMGHGFDVNGITYNKNGKNIKIQKQVMKMYYKQAECFLDQFNKYYEVKEVDYDVTTPSYGVSSPGHRTRAENMADTTGLQSVFEAYKKIIINNSGDDMKLPGFEEYTNEQMFFISFGATWCEILTPKYKKLKEKVDNHSPANLRVIGAVSNTIDFAMAFNCPIASPMNPDNKCNVWRFHDNNNYVNFSNDIYSSNADI